MLSHLHVGSGEVTVALDSPRGDVSFLSHAHRDHTSGFSKVRKVISSPATYDLAALRAEKTSMSGIKLFDAGHILGSRQLGIGEDGSFTVYTGDISLKPNILGTKAETVQCDRLIMEATYGDPRYRFPDTFEVYERMAKWISANESGNVIIGAYDLGKAQEVVKVINEYCGRSPIVNEKAEEFCSVYEKHGVKLDRICTGSDEAEEEMKKPFIAIVSMRHAKRYFARRIAQAFERATVCAAVTGWALHYRFNTDAAFPLSDHADFDDLRYYLGQSNAKKVEFFCGDGSRLLESVRRNTVTLSARA